MKTGFSCRMPLDYFWGFPGSFIIPPGNLTKRLFVQGFGLILDGNYPAFSLFFAQNRSYKSFS